ncbi:RWD domain-containing protein 4-like [Stylophora pistillata]|uniref:RWD domain-containing protein 4 n=1 Tax=Stylophora pistillata TaxID=50429 RepID=A0A2B4RUJ9_STYPI|nr:RWD domain-containing protein 4-like [Stylophora pistillata]PFX22124.1 RWD domain-containing protein 4 [Stylophora pistillata]
MSCSNDQEDEREVLRSIFEADENFIEVNSTTFQYKFGEDGHAKSFLLEISWPLDYPTCLPNINLDAFYNKHITSEVKETITYQIKEQCEICLGTAMTYSIFDWAKEHLHELLEDNQVQEEERKVQQIPEEDSNTQSRKKDKKEILTKAQKRRLADRTNFKGERERGWNWVDVVKHLSKTGGKD